MATPKPSLTNCPNLSAWWVGYFRCDVWPYGQRACMVAGSLGLFLSSGFCHPYSGGYSVGVPPLPIPNREVKPVRADGTAHPWESRSPPSFSNGEALWSERPEGFLCLWPASTLYAVPALPRVSECAKRAFRGKSRCLCVPDEGSHSSYGDGGVQVAAVFSAR